MENTMLIQLTNRKAEKLLRELEKLDIIKVLQVNASVENKKLSSKYRGVISTEEGQKLQQHTEQMRNECRAI